MKQFLGILISLFCITSQAQWAVYDHKVYEELYKINNIRKIETDHTKLDKTGGINNQVQHPTGKVPRWASTTNN